ncbi:hypothetical protein GCM10010234_17520 [Streptomyces hawaiiensis]
MRAQRPQQRVSLGRLGDHALVAGEQGLADHVGEDTLVDRLGRGAASEPAQDGDFAEKQPGGRFEAALGVCTSLMEFSTVTNCSPSDGLQ